MKVQTNITAPVFCASFAKDSETKSVLKNAITESEYSYTPIYDTIHDLENMKAQDTISISRPDRNTYVVRNNNTGAAATIKQTSGSELYFYNDFKEGVEYLSTAIRGVLFDEGNHEYMFSDTSKYNTKELTYRESQAAIAKECETQKLAIQISGLSRQYEKTNRLLDRMVSKLKDIKNLKDELETKKRFKEQEYTLSLIG